MKKILLLIGCWFWSLSLVQAQVEVGENFEAQVTQVLNEKTIVHPGSEEPQLLQELELKITSGQRQGELINLTSGEVPVANIQTYKVGDQLVIYQEPGTENYDVADFVRRPALIWLAVIFVIAAVLVGRWQGLTSLVGLVLSFVIIFYFILPQIAAGGNPILIVILGSLVIIPIIFLLSHGLNKKTIVAMISTLITMVATGLLIVFFVELSRLTGFSSEEAGFLQASSPNLINIKNLLIAGMLIATLGLLDDITVSQAAIVAELKTANPDLSPRKLYSQAMRVGRDHIASMINTLVLVYAGASFPLLLLFISSEQSLSLTLNYEIVADEIVRTLTGSIGLILAVPLTTVLAVILEEMSGPKIPMLADTKKKHKEISQ